MKKIVIIGSINMDIVSEVVKHPRPGETVKSKDFSYIPGGKGANQAVSAHRLGGHVLLLGKIGKDTFGETLLQFFKKEGMDTNSIIVANNILTGVAFVAVDSNSENVIYVSGGANDNLLSSDIKHIQIEKTDIVLATLETPVAVTQHLFEQARKIGAKTVLNAAPAILDAEAIFPLTDYLIVNETELSFFTRTKTPETKEDVVKAMQKIKGDNMKIVATLGKKGAIAVNEGEIVVVEGHVVNATDTTAAGDCFVGAFAVALKEDKTMKEAIEFANAAAAISVQRLGASSSLPTRKEVEGFKF